MSVNPDAPIPGDYVPTSGQWMPDPRQMGNTSGLKTLVPPDVAGGFNWGGCTIGCIWAFAMGMPAWGVAALASALCCTVFSLPLGLVLGIKGNEWAWQNRRFESIEHFREVQRKWAVWGIVVVAILALLYAAYYVVIVWLQISGALD